MGTELDYTQIRKNGNLYVSVDDLVKIQIARVYGQKNHAAMISDMTAAA